ncbi:MULTISPECIES: hypothetical protein [Rhizobium]|uniref:Entry exclusion lipoprotein TrbK n=1 Tax=Rhizobium hidalgonense TaxID=1538159 RepID=A0ABX4JRT8_9HYPH|nr:hypothetical protein [Rhizobium hidalgonense]PDT21865.1 hypothetical protein CO674_20225 [Rhizobium hidalgonense]PON08524.1 hypothetical protein ATY29_05920 [Rhizobium hidalgonense]UWU39083.1 hypothetical protein N2597_32835 [Rhizobium leguminosarum bv. phaseoli]
MRLILVLFLGCVALSGCAGKQEQLAKCSADENPVPALGFDKEQKPGPAERAMAAAVVNDCGPMRPVNQF